MTTNAYLAGGTEVLHFFELDAVVPTSLDIAPWPVSHTSACELTGQLTHWVSSHHPASLGAVAWASGNVSLAQLLSGTVRSREPPAQPALCPAVTRAPREVAQEISRDSLRCMFYLRANRPIRCSCDRQWDLQLTSQIKLKSESRAGLKPAPTVVHSWPGEPLSVGHPWGLRRPGEARFPHTQILSSGFH